MTTTIERSTLNATGLAHNAKAATTVAEACAGYDSVLEPKLDGIRLLAEVAEDGVRLWTRNANDKAGHLLHVEAELAEHFPVGTWLDGEAVSIGIDEAGHIIHDWGKAQSVLGGNPSPVAVQTDVSYCIFDLLAHGGIDARPLPYCKRRELLERIFDEKVFDPGAVTLVAQAEATEEAHEAMLATGFEGSMVKWLHAPYCSGKRGAGIFKIKGEATVDAFIIGWKPGKGSFTGLVGAVIFGQHDEDGNVVERGACSGMDYPTRLLITEHIDALIERKQVIEVTHNGAMPSGALRHPRFIRFRTDKDAEEVGIHDA